MNPFFDISIFVLCFGCSVVMLIYHLAQYWLGKDRLIGTFCIYLLSLCLLLGYKIYLVQFVGNVPDSMALNYEKLQELLEMFMYYSYMRYLSKTIVYDLEVTKDLKIGINIVGISIIVYLFIIYFWNEFWPIDIAFFQTIERIILFILAVWLFYCSFLLRENPIIRHIQLASFIYFIFSLISFYYGFANNQVQWFRPMHILLIGSMIDLIIFSLALAKRTRHRIISVENQVTLAKLKLLEFEHQQQLAIKQQKDLERKRISMDLHDDLGASITALKFITSIGKQDLSLDYVEHRKRYEKIDFITDCALETIHDLIWSLSSSETDLATLERKLSDYIFECNQGSCVKYDINMPDKLFKLNRNSFRNIWLILKEAINNVHKHSQASSACISVLCTSSFQMIIRDNGIGFVNSKSAGNGISNIRRRVYDMGGSARINTGQNLGTEYIIEIPITNISD